MPARLGQDVELGAHLLRAGKLVAFATETVYGLGANALDVTAVARVFAVKDRPHFDPLIVHIADRAWLPRLVATWSETAERLSRQFWPGPLTLVVPKADLVPDLVTSGLPTVAIRMPAHPLALELLRKADVPVAAPSANPFGQLSPTCAEHVAERLGDQIDYILDGGLCSVGVESTVVQVSQDRVVLLRPGGVSLEDIESAIGHVEVLTEHSMKLQGTSASGGCQSSEQPAPSPGMLPQHYAPRTPLSVIDDVSQVSDPGQAGLLALRPCAESNRFASVEVLSATGDLTEAAAHFFAALRRLDASGIEQIVAIPFPNHGLGRALNDRLMRAATK